MVRKQIYLTARQNDLLKRAAAAARRSEAELLREALDRFLESQAPRAPALPADPLWGIVGLADGGDERASERVEEALYGAVRDGD